MAQKKEHLKKLLDFIGMIVKDPENNDFKNGLQKLLGIDSTSIMPVLVDVANDKIEHIYEYCIEEIARKQAEEFYAYFPISEIASELVEDFVRMERFRREDNFGDFSLAVYQQIECITNYLYSYLASQTFFDIIKDQPAYASEQIANRKVVKNNKKIADFIKLEEESKKVYAMDKLTMVLYFVKDATIQFDKPLYESIYNIYACRNLNHRESKPTEKQAERISRILPYKSSYYLMFQGALFSYVEGISKGLSDDNISKIQEWANQLVNNCSKEKICL